MASSSGVALCGDKQREAYSREQREAYTAEEGGDGAEGSVSTGEGGDGAEGSVPTGA